MTCRVLCFALTIKGKTLALFLRCCLCCVCESLMRSRGVYLHTHLGLSRSRLMLRAWWSFQLLHKELKETQVGEFVVAVEVTPASLKFNFIASKVKSMNHLIYFEGDIILYYDIYEENK